MSSRRSLVVVCRRRELEFGKDAGDVCLDCLGGQDQPLANGLEKLGIEVSGQQTRCSSADKDTLQLTWRQRRQVMIEISQQGR